MIKYLKHKEIDKQRWDNCITESVNSLIYAFSWFLDIVSPGWDALVLDDYKAVMPLPWRKKWGIKYIFKPLFSQQLGIFSAGNLNNEMVKEFLLLIPAEFKLIHFNLNYLNHLSNINIKDFKVIYNNNFEIGIGSGYDTLYGNYNRNCTRNIKKAEKAGLVVKENSFSYPEFVEFVKKNLGKDLNGLKTDYDVLSELLKTSVSNGTGEILNVYNKKNELVAAGSFLVSKKRCIFSVCASSATGKDDQAMYLLVDHQIKKYAGRDMIFDFSGSNMQGIAYFNSTFGAKPLQYPTIKINRLPWPLKYLK